jgi:hypothetical protein
LKYGAEEGRKRSVGPTAYEKVLHKFKKKRNILNTIERRKANWIDHILCRNCLLKHIIGGKVEGGIFVMRKQGRRRKKVQNDFRENR